MTDQWNTAYLAALADPAGTLEFVPQPRSFSAQTVRQAVRLRRGGSSVRLVLSNEYGIGPLVFDQVTVGDAALASHRPALRDGRPRWVIPPGASATSDPVALPVEAGDELLVSCFVAGGAEPAAFLHSAQRTGAVAAGDQTTARHLVDAEEFGSLYWITRVLTDGPVTGPVIVAFGDSITRGDVTTIDRDQRYPDHLQRRLAVAGIRDAAVLNAGIGANGLLRPGIGPSMTERFARDVLIVSEATHVVILAGSNDIASPDRPAAGEIVGGLTRLARRARERGILPVLGTIPPFGASIYPAFRTAGNEEVRRAVNLALTEQDGWAVVDFAAALAAPDNPTRLDPALDSGDGVHPSDVGTRAMADAFDLTIFADLEQSRVARARSG